MNEAPIVAADSIRPAPKLRHWWTPSLIIHSAAFITPQLVQNVAIVPSEYVASTCLSAACGQWIAIWIAVCLLACTRRSPRFFAFVCFILVASIVGCGYAAMRYFGVGFLNAFISSVLLWPLFGMLAFLAHRVAERWFHLEKLDHVENERIPAIALHRMFAATAGFAMVYALARVIPNHFESLNSAITAMCGAAVIAIGIFAMVLVPYVATLSRFAIEVRAGLIAATIVSVGTIAPLTFQMPTRFYVGFVLVVGYFELMLCASLLPVRFAGYRLSLKQVDKIASS